MSKFEHSVNPNNWGPYAHLPRPSTDSIEELLRLSDWKLAVKELIIHSAKLEMRVAELEAKAAAARLARLSRRGGGGV